MSAITKHEGLAADIERVVIGGDLSRLTPEQRLAYYKQVCESVGLNPLTRPLQYIMLNGKLVLYAGKDATDQLRQMHQVSVTVTAREVVQDCYVVTSKATLPNGRTDEEIGAVSIVNLKGDALCNAMMKASTKSKRRVTLSICGLGMLDETELETIPPATIHEVPQPEPEPTAVADPQQDPLKKPARTRKPKPEAPSVESRTEPAPKPQPQAIGYRLSNNTPIYDDASDYMAAPLPQEPSPPSSMPAASNGRKVSPAQVRRFYSIGTFHKWSEPQIKAMLWKEAHVYSAEDLPAMATVYDRIINTILILGPEKAGYGKAGVS